MALSARQLAAPRTRPPKGGGVSPHRRPEQEKSKSEGQMEGGGTRSKLPRRVPRNQIAQPKKKGRRV